MGGFYNEIISRLGLSPEETVGGKVTIIGFDGVFIEGHKGLREYSDTSIKIFFCKKTVEISGKEMRILAISKDELYIRGKIISVGEVCE